jgi:hypothetical protein
MPLKSRLNAAMKLPFGKIAVLLALFAFNACYHYHVLRYDRPAPMPIDPNLKVAMIGFYPYKYNTISAGNYSFAIITDLDTQNPTSTFFSSAKRIEEYPIKGMDSTVPLKHIKQFVNDYRAMVGVYGETELRKVVQWTGETGSETFAFKKRDVDFYILAAHGPENEDQNFANSLRFLVSVPFSALTLGLIPIWSTRDTESTFIVYDNHLNQVGKKVYQNKYTVFGSWWGRKEEGKFGKELPRAFRMSLYKSDIEDFVDFFPSLMPPIKK